MAAISQGSRGAELPYVYQDFFKKVQELPVRGESDPSEEKKSLVVWIQDSEGLHKDVLLEVVGYGGFKKAVKLESGLVLLIRNMDVENIEDVEAVSAIAARWQSAVKEEVGMSQWLSKLDLLSPLSQEVCVFLAPDAESSIAAYSSESFDGALSRGVHIIDVKNPLKSTWKICRDRIFSSEEERMKLESWDSMVRSLLKDVAQVCKYDVPYGVDSLNIAIIKTSDDPLLYAIRYYGFDFSSKHGSFELPDGSLKDLSLEEAEPLVKYLLTRVFDKVLEYEYAPHFSGEADKLRDFLVERYAPQVMEILQGDHK